jgi:hypothetical protein
MECAAAWQVMNIKKQFYHNEMTTQRAKKHCVSGAFKQRDRNNFHQVAVPVGVWIPEHCSSYSHQLGRWWGIQW